MADQDAVADWAPEAIPPNAKLYMRVHKSYVRNGDFQPGVFSNKGEGSSPGMSTEWEKYSTPEEARGRSKVPADNGVIALEAGPVREIEGLTVEHTPDLERRIRGHTDVFGPKTPQARVMLKRIAKWVDGFELP